MPLPARKKDWLPLCVLLGFCLFLFRDVVWGGHYLYGHDFNAFYVGMKQFFYDEWHNHGSIPQWNPFLLGGIPFWAHFESTLFYPLGFLFWFLPAAEAYGYTMCLHLFLAGVFTYALARSFSINRPGSFLAAAVFTCNGFVMALLYLGHMSPVQSYIWLPAIITCLNRSLRGLTPRRDAALAGLFWGIQILAGAPQDAFYGFLASMVFILCASSSRLSSLTLKRRIVKIGTIALIQFTVGAGIAAIQIIPAFEFIQESVRAAQDSYEDVTMASYPPEGLITALLPHFFGDYTQNSQWVANVPFSIPQQNVYLGIVPVLMGFLIAWSRLPDRPLLVYLTVLAAVALVLALGKHTPIYRLVYLLPGFDRFRAPSKILVLWAFAGSLLAGWGMSDFSESKVRWGLGRLLPWLGCLTLVVLLDLCLHWEPGLALKAFSPFLPHDMLPGKLDFAAETICRDFHRFTILISLSTMVLSLVIRKSLRKDLAIAVLCVILLFDLILANGASVRRDDAFYARTSAIRSALQNTLGRDDSVFRVGSFRSSLSPNTEMLMGYQAVGGYTALFLHRYYEYINYYAEGALPRGWSVLAYGRERKTILMDLLNVKYELSHDAGQVIFRETYLPRAFIVPNSVVKGKEEVLPWLTNPGFNPRVTVVLEQSASSAFGHPSPANAPFETAQAQVLFYRPDRIQVKASSPRPGYLFLSENHYPGWKALVDEEPVPILRGNYLFRVIPIPQGDHVVEVVFEPWSIRLGVAVTLLTLACLAGGLALRLKRSSGGKPGLTP